MLLFYEPANWLAFIIYFVVGASCGYVQLRNTETARFVQEENELLHKRLEFTRKLYQDTLEDKRSFRRQILGRRDSFGKIYAVTQQLDMLQPQEICRKTVQIMEDVLENHSLTIYRMEKNQGFARLTAASAGMTPEPAYSLEVDQWLDVIRAIEQEGLWVNRGFLRTSDVCCRRAAERQPCGTDRAVYCQRRADDPVLPESVPHPLRTGGNSTGAGL